MSRLWVIVADKSRARFFTVSDTQDSLLSIDELTHPEGRQREQALMSDRPGRSFDSKGQGRHDMGASVEPGKAETIRFSRQVADHVQAAHNEGRCDRVLLVAGPPLLGLLRDDLSTVSGLRVSDIDKNLGQYDAREIRRHLPDRL